MRRFALAISMLLVIFTFSNCDSGTSLLTDSIDSSTDITEEIKKEECPACNCNCNVVCPGVDTHAVEVVDSDVAIQSDAEVMPADTGSPSEDVEPPPKDVESPLDEVEPPPEDVESPFDEVEPPPKDVESPFDEVEPPPEDVESPFDEVEPPQDVLAQTFTVSIMSTPIMTNCTVDGSFVGLVPVDTNDLELTAGFHDLLLQKGGCEDLEETIEVSATSTTFYFALTCGK